MSSPVVVDSCVAYKWFYRENEHGLAQADELLQAHLDRQIVLVGPTTLPVELSNTLRYAKRSEEEILHIIELIEAAKVELFPTTTQRLQHAVVAALAHNLCIYDALFLALAEELGCPLVTADRKAFANLDTNVEIRLI
jgi:predicted nucleic acid-binding protein